ncbi:hypothetical protein [Marinobacterium marinum]|uniref:Uncharacterized protein n=1 Tax=Marinobacterium marinum TaxID=2756129 RepID=A0A7W2ACI9_9GAMM|nr:hypothetical protein [Marinobacterium marinum]MBA4503175.1 hypothetical protein [Marinobacterium marinum]
MESLRNLTLFCVGLSGAEKEKLLSVLVLAEIRLRSVWALQEQPEGADAYLCKANDKVTEHPGVLIRYRAPDSEQNPTTEEGVFQLGIDASGVPMFSELVAVLNQADAWLAARPEKPEPVEPVRVENDQSRDEIPSLAETENTAVAVRSVEEIPTLEPVSEPIVIPDLPDEIMDSMMSEFMETSRKIPFLDLIAEYVQDLRVEYPYHKILLQSGEVILFDLDQGKFYSTVEIQNFLDRKGDNKTSYISALDRQEFLAELNKQDYFERPFSNLRWFLALFSNVGSLDIDIDNQAFILTGWPSTDLPGLNRAHLKLSAFMLAKKASIAEISAETGFDVALIQSFVEACHHEGLIQANREPEEKSYSVPQKNKGFWGGVLRKIKW